MAAACSGRSVRDSSPPLVVYRPLYNATGWWVRPHAMFFETVEIEGRAVIRFQRI